MNSSAEINDKSLKIAIACGGTGGHLFPGVAVADALCTLGHQALLLLSDKQVDRKAAESVDHLALTLPSVAWQKGRKLKFIGKLGQGLLSCHSIFNEHQPDAVMAMGGFTSVVPVMMARMQRRPVFLHESNTIAGRAIRKLANWADLGFLGFECAKDSLPGLQCQVTGTPVRESLRNLDQDQCRRELGFQPHLPLLLITGGSQGALNINQRVIENLSALKSAIPDIQVLHLCGHHDDEQKIRDTYQKHQINAQVHPFFSRMDLALGAADMSVGRSGASFMAELAATRLPSLLIPLPSSADGHQLKNAQTLEKLGAAICMEESSLRSGAFIDKIKTLLLDGETRLKMASALASLDRPDAAEQIVRHMLKKLGCIENIESFDHEPDRESLSCQDSNEQQQLIQSPSLS